MRVCGPDVLLQFTSGRPCGLACLAFDASRDRIAGKVAEEVGEVSECLAAYPAPSFQLFRSTREVVRVHLIVLESSSAVVALWVVLVYVRC